MLLHLEDSVSSSFLKDLERVLKERLKRKPLPYILKETFFWGRPFYVEEGVLIPRQDTELLIEIILKEIGSEEKKEFFEIGVGSGIISITLLLERKNLKGFCNDISQKAIEITLKNAKTYNVLERLFLWRGNLFQELKERIKFDFIVSNPPYISQEEWKFLSEEVKNFEPEEALISGEKGTEFQERIVIEGFKFLKKNGFILLEMGYNQKERLEDFFKKLKVGFKFFKDYGGRWRVVKVWRS